MLNSSKVNNEFSLKLNIFPILMLFKVIYHKRKPCKASETLNRSIREAILISETSSVVSGVTASCNIKHVFFFFSGSK